MGSLQVIPPPSFHVEAVHPAALIIVWIIIQLCSQSRTPNKIIALTNADECIFFMINVFGVTFQQQEFFMFHISSSRVTGQ